MARTEKSITTPIVAGVIASIFTVAILVGWSIIFPFYYILASETQTADLGVGYWLVLSVGCALLVAIIVILIVFIVAHVRQTLYVRRVNTFIDSVTHELNSPLASIRLGLETLEMREVPPEVRRKLLKMMKADVDRLGSFIKLVLEAGRLEHGERGIELMPTDVCEVVGACVAATASRYEVEPAAFQVHCQLPADLRPMLDPVAIEVVVLNLLSNAVKYSAGRLDVRVTVTRAGEWLAIAVEDSGIGIPQGKLKKVFRRFYRVDLATRVKGTGLGLYLVQKLIEQLGGEVSVSSDGEGMGATFVVRVPMAPDVSEQGGSPRG